MRRIAAVMLILCLVLCPAMALAQDTAPVLQESFAGPALPEGWSPASWYSDAADFSVEAAGDAVRIENPVENDVRLRRTLSVEPDACYTLSCDIKIENVQSGAGANVSVEESFATSNPIFGTADYVRVELTGRTGPAQDTLTVCVRLGGYGALSTGTAWFKNFRVQRVEDTALAVSFAAAQSAAEEEESYTAGKVPYFGAMLLCTLLTAGMALALERGEIGKRELGGEPPRYALAALLAGAFLLRCLLSLRVRGHATDINCFMAWGNALCENGISAFYTSGMFADYPPGYMYALLATSTLAKWLGMEYGGTGYILLTKMPAILADIASAYIVYRIAEKRVQKKTALWLCAAVAFNPVMVFVSGGWGQIDAILALLLAATAWYFLEDKAILAGALYGLAILVKPQALMAGPVFALAYFARIKDKRTAFETAAAVAAAFGVILLLALPFKSTQEPGWLVGKYFSTATSYPYASVEAFNLMGLLGGVWKPVDDVPFLFSYRVWGTVLMAAVLLYTGVLYLRGRKREGMAQGALWLCLAYLLCGIFSVGYYMHERYLFPALLPLLLAFLYIKDTRLFRVYGLFSASLLLNVLAAFVIVDHPECRGAQYTALTAVGSLLCVGAFAYFSFLCADILLRGRVEPAFAGVRAPAAAASAVPPACAEIQDGPLFTRRDRLLCGGLTAIYALVALCNLGTLRAPENAWAGTVGDAAEISVASGEVSAVWIYGGIAEGELEITAGDGNSVTYAQVYDDMYRWRPIPFSPSSQKLTLRVTSGRILCNELALWDRDGNRLVASSGAAALFDEQDTVPDAPSYLNGMYFDELYHGRTAYENLHGLSPYENSHPPLGKVLIMLGIAVFGMNPFGWRIVGALLGVAMLPILYAFAKRLFKSSEYAFFATALFALDFMHYTQTRIATIDVYAVFFILLMYDFMYRYYCMNFLRDGLQKTLVPLAGAGVFFGLGAASKWTCIYAGGGLAVILFTSLYQRYRESRAMLASEDPEERARGARFGGYAVKTLLWCCVFYILVPVCIYVLSYLPYALSVDAYDLKGIWGLQKFMFNYHSGLQATHPYQSAWWQWPLDLRPTWYYVGYNLDQTRAGTISAFGNPAVWWVCSAGLFTLLLRRLRDTIPGEKGMFVLLVGAAANYLPWVLVPRCTFTYHYFPMVPFIILGTVYLVRDFDRRRPALSRLKWGYVGLCLALFILFYPVISGTMVSTGYIRALEWLPSWTFLGY